MEIPTNQGFPYVYNNYNDIPDHKDTGYPSYTRMLLLEEVLKLDVTNDESMFNVHFAHGLLLFLYQLEALASGNTCYVWKKYILTCHVCSSYFTNTIILRVVNGPTEGLMLIYMAHFFTAIVGMQIQHFNYVIGLNMIIKYMCTVVDPESWRVCFSRIPIYGVVLLFINFLLLYPPSHSSNVQNVYKVVQTKNGSMLNVLAMVIISFMHLTIFIELLKVLLVVFVFFLCQFVTFNVLLVVIILWDWMSLSNLTDNYPHMALMGTGLALLELKDGHGEKIEVRTKKALKIQFFFFARQRTPASSQRFQIPASGVRGGATIDKESRPEEDSRSNGAAPTG
ncbi:hypothetical protein LXL04_038267 [Taraxacum kok-saghyz]